MRVVVTGGCGFIGQHVVQQLLDRGDDVTVVDAGTRAATGWARVLDQLGSQLVHGDVQDAQVWTRVQHEAPDVVLHLAAQSHVDASLCDPLATWAANALGTQRVAQVCAEWGVPLVYCSTDEVYGTTPLDSAGHPVAVAEDFGFFPRSPYSASKAAGEHAVRSMGTSAGLRWAITRGSNAWGPHQLHEKLVPIACGLLHQGASVPLHGGGEQWRQWLHVQEFADGLVRVADALVDGAALGKVYNLAGAELLTVRQLVEALARAAGCDPALHTWSSPNRPGQDHAYHLDGTAASCDLGWRATRKISDPASLRALLAHYGSVNVDPLLADFCTTR